MVVASLTPARSDRIRALDIPVIDLSRPRALLSGLIMRAFSGFGLFTVINHGIPDRIIAKMEARADDFFSQSTSEKQRAGPASPLGYGIRTIGCNGDAGEVEYLLLHTNPTISKEDPAKFSCVVNEYVEAVRELACDILELLCEGLGLEDTEAFSRLLRDSHSDSLMRLNYYPPCYNNREDYKNSSKDGRSRVGFGEHTDPQILTLLRSNAVGGLQVVSPSDGGTWVPVPPNPAALCVMAGDVLQAMTNGKIASARHRAMVDPFSTRLSMAYFGAPPLDARISPLPEMITQRSPRRYKSFTWGEYKKAMYSLRLGHNRLDLFGTEVEERTQP